MHTTGATNLTPGPIPAAMLLFMDDAWVLALQWEQLQSRVANLMDELDKVGLALGPAKTQVLAAPAPHHAGRVGQTGGSEGGADLSPGVRFLRAITPSPPTTCSSLTRTVQCRSVPLTAVRNASLNCMQVMWVALFADGSVRPDVFAEQQQERRYGRVKSFFRGMPSIRDGVMGTQKLHLQQMRQRHADPTHPGDTISAATAQDIAREARGIACRIQSWIVPGRTPDAIAKDGLTLFILYPCPAQLFVLPYPLPLLLARRTSTSSGTPKASSS